ncbi:hypothetical protein [Haloarcula sebkhae]|uniref:Uncharacterized protein n=2 Tax=Haloarcula sebkhae TaxID=932660 RepID=A0ACC6VKS2_9EURY|nr:hypothetical protein [Haloarcula sebkhae]GGK67604.1 hypothetical protein GCM10009067_19880 [Haloarcula sebkhae]
MDTGNNQQALMTRTTLRMVGTLLLALLTGASLPDDARNAVGPPGSFPDPVSDFMTASIELVQEFLTGGSDASPGPAVSGAATGAGV